MFINYFIKFKKRVALIDAKRNQLFLYEDLLKKIKYYDKFIKKNSVIVILASNNVETIAFYLSCLNSKKKCVSIILDETFNKNFIESIIKKYKANIIFYPTKTLINKSYKKKLIIDDQVISETNYAINNINTLNKLLLTTSGTTGSSKFVRLSKSNLESNSKSIIKSLKINKNHTAMTMMPLGYSYGLSILNTHLMKGAKIIISQKSIFEKDFWIFFKKFKVNSLSGVPAFYEYIKKLDLKKLNLKKLVYISQAGGHLEAKTKNYLYNFAKKFHVKFYLMYGQTEASPRISCLDVIKYPKKIRSVGKAIDGVHVKTIDKIKVAGELHVKGKNVCLGYSNNILDLKKGDINRGHLNTGDLGYLDKDQFIHIKGRAKRFSKLYGFRINLDDIEIYLNKMHITCNCCSDDKKIFIKYEKLIDLKKIKKILYFNFNINPNSLEIIKVKKLDMKNTLKQKF